MYVFLGWVCVCDQFAVQTNKGIVVLLAMVTCGFGARTSCQPMFTLCLSRAQHGSTRKRLYLLTSILIIVLPSIVCLLQVYREGRTIEFVKEPVEKLIIARSWTAKQV